MNSNWSYSPDTPNLGQYQWFFLLCVCVTYKFDGWPWKTIGNLFYTTLSFVYHFKAIGKLKLELPVRKRSIRVKISDFFVPCDLKIWGMTLKNNRAPLLCCLKLCASSHNHHCIQTGVTVGKRPIWVKISDFFVPYDLEILWMTLKNNRAPFLCYIKLCASFYNYQCIQSGVTVQKHPIWVKIDIF